MGRILILCFLLSMSNAFAQKVIPLYPDTIPNSYAYKDEEHSEFSNGVLIISKISTPNLTIYQSPKKIANGTAVIICPGGGYWVNAAKHEGYDLAKKFNEVGITAIVLKYRIPNDLWMKNREIGPLQDAQQAIKVTRENAKKWGINPSKIGLMGFSAGGHLASTAGTHFDKCYINNEAKTSLRPDFMMLIYPVISFDEKISHKGSAIQLLGEKPSQEKLDEYSNEKQVNTNTPPTFLVHASDDDAVHAKNSIVFYEALLNHKVPAELHIYQKGGHGFGLNIKNTDEKWFNRCKSWMKINGWL